MLEALGLLILGSAAGMLSGLLGIGGGVILIPGMVYFLGLGQKTAQGTSLMVMPIGLLLALEYLKRGEADWRVAVVLGIGFLVGGYLGAAWTAQIPAVLLRRLFGLFLVILGFKMFIKP